MATLRIASQKIESFLPAEEAKNRIGNLFVLDGKNFMFQPKGPGSFFGDRYLSPLPLSNPLSVQGLHLQDRTFVFTMDAILTWRNYAPYDWELLYSFDSETSLSSWSPWSGIFFAEKFWFFQEERGTYNSSPVTGSQALWLRRQTSISIPGLPEGIMGSAVVRNRAVMVTKNYIYWSNTGEMDSLAPEPGGAGFVKITEFLQGTYRGITYFGDGFIVWTSAGGILAEFIGGDLVWRWTVVKSDEKPLNAWTTIELSVGDAVYMSRHGLVRTTEGSLPEAWTPDFNEWFISTISDDRWTSSYWRVDYDVNNELVYISESADKQTFFQTYVLAPTRNKWGIFSERHYGILQLSDDRFGWVDTNGYPRYFDHKLFSRERDPDNSEGLNLYIPSHEKQMVIPSSSLVSNDTTYDMSIPIDPFYPLGAIWAQEGASLPKAASLKGMDSWIDVGYMRPQELASQATDSLEIQEIVLSSWPSAAVPGVTPAFATEYNFDAFYPEILDLNDEATVVGSDIEEDWESMPDSTEDWMALSLVPAEDWTFLCAFDVSYAEEEWLDLSVGPDSIYDLMGIGAAYPELSYQVSVLGSPDGITYSEFVPEMAKFSHNGQTFTGLSYGMYHRLRLVASELGEFYQLRAAEYTVHYAGTHL